MLVDSNFTEAQKVKSEDFIIKIGEQWNMFEYQRENLNNFTSINLDNRSNLLSLHQQIKKTLEASNNLLSTLRQYEQFLCFSTTTDTIFVE